jgi:NAD(P)-dependent dehydrogenase (short-subunit alcohol dehydrogenase family)
VSANAGSNGTSLAGKAVVITGAGGGIGRATAVACGRAGASLLLVGRTQSALEESEEATRETGADVRTFLADVSRAEDVRGYADAALSAFGTIDVLVNNAGIEGPVSQLVDYPEDEFDRVLAVNLRGTFLGMRQVLPLMIERRSGSVVNISSIAGERGLQGTAAYIASKHGILGLTRCAAAEVGSTGVRVNAVCAGMTDTRMLRTICEGYAPDDPAGMLDACAASSPAARLASPDEIASVIMFLCSDAASFVNGAAWAVDGGALGTMGGRWT